MTRVLGLLAIVALACGFHWKPLTAAGPPQAKSEAVRQVLATDEARRLAMLHADVKSLDALLADDVTIFWGDGTVDDKASTLDLFRSGRLSYSKLEYDNTRVRIYGDTAIVTGDARIQANSDQHALQHLVRVTRVYVHKRSRWQLVASQATRVESAA